MCTVQILSYCWLSYSFCAVFGLTPESLPDVLQEFGQCGEILRWGNFGARGGSAAKPNWVHLRFATPQGAQRALLRDGRCISPGVMVGVRPVRPEDQADLEDSAEKEESTGLIGAVTPAIRRRSSMMAGQAPTITSLAPATLLVPAPSQSAWSKLYSAVWGL